MFYYLKPEKRVLKNTKFFEFCSFSFFCVIILRRKNDYKSQQDLFFTNYINTRLANIPTTIYAIFYPVNTKWIIILEPRVFIHTIHLISRVKCPSDSQSLNKIYKTTLPREYYKYGCLILQNRFYKYNFCGFKLQKSWKKSRFTYNKKNYKTQNARLREL